MISRLLSMNSSQPTTKLPRLFRGQHFSTPHRNRTTKPNNLFSSLRTEFIEFYLLYLHVSCSFEEIFSFSYYTFHHPFPFPISIFFLFLSLYFSNFFWTFLKRSFKPKYRYNDSRYRVQTVYMLLSNSITSFLNSGLLCLI